MKVRVSEAPGDTIDVTAREWIRFRLVGGCFARLASCLMIAAAHANARAIRTLPAALKPSSAHWHDRRRRVLEVLLEDERRRAPTAKSQGHRRTDDALRSSSADAPYGPVWDRELTRSDRPNPGR